MKVIVAGFSKTGTKTMQVALASLGYPMYNFLEHFWYHHKDWEEILVRGGSIGTFRRMYNDVDAVGDIPAFAFWEEIHEAFPDSKIILLTRDENSWYRSVLQQFEEYNEWNMFKLSRNFTPTGRKFTTHFVKCLTACFGIIIPSAWRTVTVNETLAKKNFRQHNFYVTQKAPKHKLLIFKLQDGWKPLCEFLGVEVPNVKFPHKNVGGSAIKEAAEDNPVMKKMIKEMKILVSFVAIIFAGLLAYGFAQ